MEDRGREIPAAVFLFCEVGERREMRVEMRETTTATALHGELHEFSEGTELFFMRRDHRDAPLIRKTVRCQRQRWSSTRQAALPVLRVLL